MKATPETTRAISKYLGVDLSEEYDHLSSKDWRCGILRFRDKTFAGYISIHIGSWQEDTALIACVWMVEDMYRLAWAPSQFVDLICDFIFNIKGIKRFGMMFRNYDVPPEMTDLVTFLRLGGLKASEWIPKDDGKSEDAAYLLSLSPEIIEA